MVREPVIFNLLFLPDFIECCVISCLIVNMVIIILVFEDIMGDYKIYYLVFLLQFLTQYNAPLIYCKLFSKINSNKCIQIKNGRA